MKLGFIPLTALVFVFFGCSVTPDEHRDLAYKKYSLDCVARGLPEDSPAHTDCVVQKYKHYNDEQSRAEGKMQELYAEKESPADKSVENSGNNTTTRSKHK